MTINRRSFLAGAAACAAANSTLGKAFGFATAPGDNLDLSADPRRPQFHLLPARNWMNDPNGPIYWKGHYHMFFQYNPNAAVWGDMHWAHAISPDMVHWKHLPVALASTPGGPDADGCFSGTAVVNNGVPTFIYTGVQSVPQDQATLRDSHNNFRETQLYATSTDPELRNWTKLPAPVIAAPPYDMQVTGFRDPAPWRENDAWYMAVGSGIRGKGGAILLYKSADLKSWQYQHILISDAGKGSDATNPVDSGDMWECPDVFPLGDKHVLIYSTQGKVFWQTGELDPKELVFHPQQSGLLDYGSFYAPKTQLDRHGNRVLWGWIPETRTEAEYSAAGWAGLMSLPRTLTLGPDGRLRIGVAPAVEKLRQHEQNLTLSTIQIGFPLSPVLVGNVRIQDTCGELLCIVRPGHQPFTLDLIDARTIDSGPTHLNPGAASATNVDVPLSYLSVRYSQANPKEVVVDQQRLPVNLAEGEPLELHFYIDGSVIELFINRQITHTKRFYVGGQIAPEIAVCVTGNKADLTRLSLWQLSPISPNRLTT